MEVKVFPKSLAIDIGDSLPSLTLKNERDEDIDVSTLTAEKGVVFFLVPKADTRELNYVRFGIRTALLTTIIDGQRDGTNQACGFRDILP